MAELSELEIGNVCPSSLGVNVLQSIIAEPVHPSNGYLSIQTLNLLLYDGVHRYVCH